MRRSTALAGALAAGATILLTGPAAQAADTDVIYVPDDFVAAYTDTRATGSYAVEGTGLRITTRGSTSTDKVAEYVATDVSLADAGDSSLDYTAISGTTPPGFQLRVDFDGDGDQDGILVGEDVYGDKWWLSKDAQQSVKDDAPRTGGGSGSDWFGTLDEWSEAFPQADVLAFGFSLGSGVKGDGVIESIEFAGTRYTFAVHVTLTAKQDCKSGGWATSTKPVFRNQGECVASLARPAGR